MNVLFITSNRLGDAVLSTGLLEYITQNMPQASVTIVCGSLPSSIFAGLPGLKEIIPLKKQKYNKHWIGLWKHVIGTKWEMVIDLRDSAVSRLIFAKQRHIYSRHIDKTQHKVEQCAATMKLAEAPAPKIRFTEAQLQEAGKYIPSGQTVLAIGATANWIGKTWPAENFIRLIEDLTAAEGLFPHAPVAVFAAPGEEEGAYKVLNSIPGDRQIDVIAKTDPGTAAAILSKCSFYVGNDSGLMHCAAASGVRTMGLFGPSYPHLYRPWGDHCAYISTDQNFDELTDFAGYDPKTLDHSLMTSLRVEDVLKTCETLCNK